MKKKTKYTDETLGPVQIVKDFLPPPEALVLRDEPVKVTMLLSKSIIDFFKSQAKKLGVPYQTMIRRVLDLYATQYRT